jgi:ADP-ribose pyrophosphatase
MGRRGDANDPNSGQVTLAEGKHLRLVRAGGWEYVERPNASGIVALAAVTDDDRIILIEQFRPPVGRRVIELPAGLAGDIDAGEALTKAARRELLEETGYAARRLRQVTVGPPSAGQSTEVITMYLATGLKKVEASGGDGSEDIQVHEVEVTQAAAWLKRRARGRYIDPKVYTGLYFIEHYLRERGA